jgi:hypothetical protein
MQDRATHIFSRSSIIRTFGRLPAFDCATRACIAACVHSFREQCRRRGHPRPARGRQSLHPRRRRLPLLKVNSMTANLFAMLILSRRRYSSRRSRLGQRRGVPARMRTSLRSLLVPYEGRSLFGQGRPELFGFTEARHGMVARGDSDRRLCSLRRRSQSRERGRRRCIGAG